VSGWLIAALVLVAAALVLLALPIRVRLRLQGKGEPNGFWALAGGAQVGPAAASGVAAQGVEPLAQLHVFGRKLWEKKLLELLARDPDEDEDEKRSLRQRGEQAISKLSDRYRALERRLDPVELLFFVVRERRRIRIETLVIELEYSFVDIALTGKLLGAIYAFSAVLPDPVVVRQTPSWESVDRVSFAGSGCIKVWPGLLLVDSAWFLIRNVRVRRRSAAAKAAREAT